ncbi:MAG TPA: OmpA family protein [Roseomonas sp.]|jgi:outer membrane protein OmpA-like peptidoglycan-associated protein
MAAQFACIAARRMRRGSVTAALVLALMSVAGCVATPSETARPAIIADYDWRVFFDWDRADLTDRSRQVLAQFAPLSTSVNATSIEVSGHADRSGWPVHNQRLSERRANTVAAELVRLGVPARMITISAFGGTRPLVPTADGAREPQNRRVDLVAR